MKLSLFTEVQCPPEARPEIRMRELLDQAALADELGYNTLWISEIHFQPQFSLLSAPYVVLGAFTQRTRRLRLGVAVNLLAVHHPVHLAEHAALLDLLSGGRMEFAVGRGHPHSRVYEGFEVERVEDRGAFEEAIEVIRHAWTDDVLQIDGRHYRVPGVIPNPRPLQQPPPTIHLATRSAEGIESAVRLALGVLIPVQTLSRHSLYALAAGYWRAVRTGGQDEQPRQLGLLLPLHVAESDDLARSRAERSIMGYYRVLDETREDYRQWLERRGLGGEPFPPAPWEGMTYDRALAEHVVIGSPHTVATAIAELKEHTGATHVLCWMNIGSLPHEHVVESMQLFAREVLPTLTSA